VGGIEEAVAQAFHHHCDAYFLRFLLTAANHGREHARGNGRDN
jgi:hypothetical protein